MCAAHYCIIKIKFQKSSRKKQTGMRTLFRGTQRRFPPKSIIENTFQAIQSTFSSIFLFDPSRSELIPPGLAVRVDPVRLLYPLKCSFVQCRKYHKCIKWCRRASHLGRFTLWNNGRRASHLGRFTLWNNGRRATQLGRFTLWHYGRLATQLSRFTLWHNRR